MSDPLALVLGLINTVRLQACSVAVEQASGALAVELRGTDVALQDGVTEGVVAEDVNVRVDGLALADLKKPGPDLVKKLHVLVRHVAVRVSRDWLNSALAREPMLAEKGVRDAQIVFPPERDDQIIVRATVKGLAVQVTIRLGISENRLIVIIDGVQLLGLLPVPRWLRNFVLGLVRQRLEGLPGVKYTEGAIEVDALSVSPVPVQARFSRFVTRGRHLLLELGEV